MLVRQRAGGAGGQADGHRTVPLDRCRATFILYVCLYSNIKKLSDNYCRNYMKDQILIYVFRSRRQNKICSDKCSTGTSKVRDRLRRRYI